MNGWGSSAPLLETGNPPVTSLAVRSLEAVQKEQRRHNPKAGSWEFEGTQKVEGYQPHHREDLGHGFPGDWSPGSCTGPQHKEKTRVQSLVFHYRESCADLAGSAVGRNSFPSSSSGPAGKGACKEPWSSCGSSCPGGPFPVQLLPTPAGRP